MPKEQRSEKCLLYFWLAIIIACDGLFWALGLYSKSFVPRRLDSQSLGSLLVGLLYYSRKILQNSLLCFRAGGTVIVVDDGINGLKDAYR